MHLNAHAFAGAAIYATAARLDPASAPVMGAAAIAAFGSHFVLDKVGEPRWSRAQHTLFDGAFMALFAALVAASWQDYGKFMLLGALLANIPDIWDKKFYLSILDPERWPAFDDFFCHRKGYESIKPTASVTVLLSVLLYAGTLVVVVA